MRQDTHVAAGKMVPSIDRVYVNEQARDELGWRAAACRVG